MLLCPPPSRIRDDPCLGAQGMRLGSTPENYAAGLPQKRNARRTKRNQSPNLISKHMEVPQLPLTVAEYNHHPVCLMLGECNPVRLRQEYCTKSPGNLERFTLWLPSNSYITYVLKWKLKNRLVNETRDVLYTREHYAVDVTRPV